MSSCSLEARGFDKGERGCSQCEALSINGIACHETGCPNQVSMCRSRYCDNIVERRGQWCEECA